MKHVTLIAGLPGSGKTRFISDYRIKGVEVIDDYKGFLGNNSSFSSGRNFVRLKDVMRNQDQIVIIDCDFCDTLAREEAETNLKELFPDITINWIFFENDPETCKRNVMIREKDKADTYIKAIEDYSARYFMPENAYVEPCYKGEDNYG